MSFVRKHLVTILVAFSLIALWWFVLRDNHQGTPQGAAPPSQEQGLLEASLQNARGQQGGTVAEKPLPTPPPEPQPQANEVLHHEHGAAIRSLGSVVVRDGVKYQLLHTEAGTGRRRVLMYPTNRSLQKIKENMSFIGFKPPMGELAVFATVDDPQLGPMNVFAWKLH